MGKGKPLPLGASALRGLAPSPSRFGRGFLVGVDSLEGREGRDRYLLFYLFAFLFICFLVEYRLF